MAKEPSTVLDWNLIAKHVERFRNVGNNFAFVKGFANTALFNICLQLRLIFRL